MSDEQATIDRADAASTADREIVLTRVFDAPRELVFQAYTDPAHLPRWFGPHGFTVTTHEIDSARGALRDARTAA